MKFYLFCLFYYVDLKEMINLAISADKKARGIFPLAFFDF
ncbi:hypothetical protein B4102_3541 [Heyndrickxia sporothermodurans]|uniref:Uncharacterized protein n=1 Tax=Heyndrickxia sporothermodurans TaxID=46224 RepID=A0A150KN36_9BACI|nr:hypothetical protein B4102_3541 [Heyndrickxia sporothermodurans]